METRRRPRSFISLHSCGRLSWLSVIFEGTLNVFLTDRLALRSRLFYDDDSAVHRFLLTPTRCAGVKRSSASVFVSVFPHDRTKTTQTRGWHSIECITHAGSAAPSRWARLPHRDFLYFLTLWPWPLTFWPVFIDERDIAMDHPCVKFGDFGFSRFGFIVQTVRHTHQTDRITDYRRRE